MSKKDIVSMDNIIKFQAEISRTKRLMKKVDSKIDKLKWASPCGTLDEKHLNNLIDAINGFYELSHYIVVFLGGDVSHIEKIKSKIDSLREVHNLEPATPDMLNQFIRVLTDFTYVLDDALEKFELQFHKEIRHKFGKRWHLYKDMKPYYNLLRVVKAGDTLYASNVNNIINYFMTLIEKFLDRAYFLFMEMYHIEF